MKILSPFLSPVKKRRSAARDATHNLPTKTTSCCTVDVTVSSSDESSLSDCDHGDVNRVRFSREATTRYESPWIIIKDDIRVDDIERDYKKTAVVQPDLWYHKTDIGCFRSNIHVLARMLQMKERAERKGTISNVFCDTMWDAYIKFRHVDNCNAMNELMKAAYNLNIEADHVGLESWLQNGSALRSQTRKTMYEDIMRAQANNASDKQLRRICREHSRGSRLYAHFIGRAVAST